MTGVPNPEPMNRAGRSLARHVVVFFALAIVGQNADLVTKEAAFTRIDSGETVEAVPGVVQFEKVLNPGIVFGLGQNYGPVFAVVSVAAVPLIVWIFLSAQKQPRWITTISLGIILAGTLGNMYDRLTLGEVRDFIKIHPSLFNFPLFNVADSCISVGVSLMVADILVFEPLARRAGKRHPTPPVHEADSVPGELPPR
jgi:signal peptidase II